MTTRERVPATAAAAVHLESRGTDKPRAVSRGANAPTQRPRRVHVHATRTNTQFGQGELPLFAHSPSSPWKKSPTIHFFIAPFANRVGTAPAIHPMSQMDNSSSPLLPLPFGMFSCAHVRANYFSISRVFDCSRQSSSSSSSVDRPSKHDTFPFPRPLP